MIGTSRKKDIEITADSIATHKPVLVGFRTAYVFDISQTYRSSLEEPEAK